MKTVVTEAPGSPQLLALGDAAWTVEFGDRIDPALHARVLGLAAALDGARKMVANVEFAAVIDVVPTFRSLTVYFDPQKADAGRLGEALLRLAENAGQAEVHGRNWQIPVCFDDEFAPDLSALASAKGLHRDGAIELITGAVFQVYMIGFMPGFPYMGGLPSALEVPRLASPRKAVPARSLAIAGAMCAVYPWESPGGWHLVGRTPVPMFSAADTQSPSLLAAGDRVRWVAIDRARFLDMEAEMLAAMKVGRLDRSGLLLTGQAQQ